MTERELERVRENLRAAATDDLLERVTAYREGNGQVANLPHFPFRVPFFKSAQGDGVVAQALEALVGDEVVVLNADAANARHVEARLQRHDITGQESFIGLPDEERC